MIRSGSGGVSFLLKSGLAFYAMVFLFSLFFTEFVQLALLGGRSPGITDWDAL